MILLFILQMIDFGLTYWGIHGLQVLEEANPFMIWLFELPFLWSLLARLAILGALLGLIWFIKVKAPHRYKLVLGIGLAANFFIIGVHAKWIWMYFTI